MKTTFDELTDAAQIWLYAADHTPDATKQAAILASLHAFLSGWESHGRTVYGDAKWIADRFLCVAGYMPQGAISGCGIDDAVRAVQQAGVANGLIWISPLMVFYRDAAGLVQAVSRAAFRQLVQSGTVDADSSVFDLGITSLGDLRSGRFELPAGQSWHKRIFRIPDAILG